MGAMTSAATTTHPVLIIDDDEEFCSLIAEYLADHGYQVEAAHTGPDGIARSADREWHAIILDVMLPGCDGFEVLRGIRGKSRVPILMLTARDDEIDRVLGLEIGADDYVVKPFSLRELSARVKALLRRASTEAEEAPSTLPQARELVARQLLDLHIDPAARSARVAGQPVDLSRREFDLLWVLVRHPGRVLTREWLMNEVWGRDFDGIDRTVDVHVRKVREKLGSAYIETVKGVGYRLAERIG